MIVLLLWLAGLILLVSYESWWPILFRLEMRVIQLFGRIEPLIEHPRDAETSEGMTD